MFETHTASSVNETIKLETIWVSLERGDHSLLGDVSVSDPVSFVWSVSAEIDLPESNQSKLKLLSPSSVKLDELGTT